MQLFWKLDVFEHVSALLHALESLLLLDSFDKIFLSFFVGNGFVKQSDW